MGGWNALAKVEQNSQIEMGLKVETTALVLAGEVFLS